MSLGTRSVSWTKTEACRRTQQGRPTSSLKSSFIQVTRTPTPTVTRKEVLKSICLSRLHPYVSWTMFTILPSDKPTAEHRHVAELLFLNFTSRNLTDFTSFIELGENR